MISQSLVDVTVADGKYRIVQDRERGAKALRYGEEWLDVTTTPGANLILAMAYELDELRGLVREAAEQFRIYEASHTEKMHRYYGDGPEMNGHLGEQAEEKAKVNRDWAEKLEKAVCS